MNHELRSALLRTLPFLIVLIAGRFIAKRKNISLHDLDIRQPYSLRMYLVWTLGFLIYCLLIELSLYHFGILEITPWSHSIYPSVILIFGAIILAPLAEELIFRGLILNVLRKKTNVHIAILIQACFFVLLHNFTYQNTTSSNIGIVQSLIDAILFGYARVQTKSLLTPITMHVTGNAIAILERFIF